MVLFTPLTTVSHKMKPQDQNFCTQNKESRQKSVAGCALNIHFVHKMSQDRILLLCTFNFLGNLFGGAEPLTF